MKERIKELAEQAVQLVADEHTKGDVSRLNTDSYHVKDLINKKFAELIAKECVDIALEQKKWVEDMETLSLHDEIWNRARIQQSQHIVNKIKQHFGVEE